MRPSGGAPKAKGDAVNVRIERVRRAAVRVGDVVDHVGTRAEDASGGIDEKARAD